MNDRFPAGMTVQALAVKRERGDPYAVVPWECWDDLTFPVEASACHTLHVDPDRAITHVCLLDAHHRGPCGWHEVIGSMPYAL